MKNKNKGKAVPPGHLQFWMMKHGFGDAAIEGILITDNSPLPKPIAWIDSIGTAGRKAAERIALGDPIMEWAATDYSGFSVDDCAKILDGNLLFPFRPLKGEWIDDSNPDRAAARYTADANGFSQFSIFSFAGLHSLIARMPFIYDWISLKQAMTSMPRAELLRSQRESEKRAAEKKEAMRRRLVEAESPRIFGNHPKKSEGK